MVFFEKVIVYMPGKFCNRQILVIRGQNLAIFAKIDSFESFLSFQTSKRRYEYSLF